MGIFGFGEKRKSKAQILAEKQANFENLVQENTALQQGILKVAQENTVLNRALKRTTEEMKTLVLENEKTKNTLIAREGELHRGENDLAERRAELRKQGIEITARIADVRRRESIVQKRDEDLDEERESIRHREKTAEKLKDDSEKTKKDFEEKRGRLEKEKAEVDAMKKETAARDEQSRAKETAAAAIHEKAKTIDEELEKKAAAFESERAEIEVKLKEKIAEFDRKIADIEEAKNTVDSVKFDKSEEGKQAKIVVQEAIRRARKNLEDDAKHFGELQEKYGKGTFRGFAMPLDEIDEKFHELKNKAASIKEHAAEDEDLSIVTVDFLAFLDECLVGASVSISAWEFSEAFCRIVYGLATCKNYELLLTVLNAWEDRRSSGGAKADDAEEDGTASEPDYYKILGVSSDATREEIKKAGKEAANKWHPDKCPEGASVEEKQEYEKKMKEINKAKEVLLDGDKRKAYDSKNEQWRT